MLIYLDGKLLKKSEAKVSVFDHGLLYGDGVFEGIRSYSGRIFKFDEHINRLYRSANAICLKVPLTKESLKKAVIKTLKANSLKDAYIRVVVTRGVGDLGLDPRKCPHPTLFIITDKISLYPPVLYQKGLEIVTVATRRNAPDALSGQIKSLNYLNNILGKIEAINAGVVEGVMLDQNGFVAEGTGDNIFIVRDKILFTPPSSVGALPGITQACVVKLASRLKLNVQEALLTRFDLFSADEMFLTGTAAEIIPVVCIDGRLIGQGIVGRQTKRFMSEFRQLTKKEGTRYAV